MTSDLAAIDRRIYAWLRERWQSVPVPDAVSDRAQQTLNQLAQQS